ncbi:MAG: STAS domain-containing protein [Gammaproteobacteria bacterium]|nr:STAS domain-containing protein [Gammaproteobacteria bacterium]
MAVKSSISDDGKMVLIQVDGKFDFSLHRDFREAFNETVGAGVVYIVDLRATEYLDSSALGMLLLLKEHAGGGAGNVTIKNCNSDVLSILKTANFDKLFDIS